MAEAPRLLNVVQLDKRLMTLYLDVDKGVARCDFRNGSNDPANLVGYRIDIRESNRAYEWEESTKRCCYHNDNVILPSCLPTSSVNQGEVKSVGMATPSTHWRFFESFDAGIQINTTYEYLTTNSGGEKVDDCLVITSERYIVASSKGRPPHRADFWVRDFFDYKTSIADYRVFDPPPNCSECFIGMPLCYS